MSTKLTISILALLTIIFSYFTIQKMKAKAQIEYQVITFEKYNLCFLIDPSYKIEKNNDVFKYQAGKNLGSFSIEKRDLSSDMKHSFLGDFKGAYKKEIDLRIFEYEIAKGVILKDVFDFVKKTPPNILPVRSNCSEYLKRFKVLFRL